MTNGLPQFGPCVIRVSGAGPSRARAIWGLERRAEWMRRKQPEVEPYCACESYACCEIVAVRRVGERARPDGPWAAGAGLCEGGGTSPCLPGVSVMRRCGPRVRGPCLADHVGGPCRAGARRTGPGRAEPVRGRALYLP